MSIVTSQEMFAKAYAGGYAIGAFNVNNMEIMPHHPLYLKVDTKLLAFDIDRYLRARAT